MSQIINRIPIRAEIGDIIEDFSKVVDEELRNGNVLLLIDGLDEISEEKVRITFVNQLRTFMGTYPSVKVVVTSREAGFRIIGNSLSAYCEHYTLSEFDNNDIRKLTIAWHREVVGDKIEVKVDAEKLADTICYTKRVRDLARNPLLLTTLLLVKRWVGQLPTRRSVLYGKAIEVLLMTWNVEAHEPLDQYEAIPQLAFLAYSMMEEGIQRISEPRLRSILSQARKQMPEVYPKLSISEFIGRIELRSSLLMLSGHEVEEGKLNNIYEFQHLTFQEYLAAVALIEGYYPDRDDKDTLLDLLMPYLSNEQWKEVIPLAAVLSGRKVQPIIKHLIELTEAFDMEEKNMSERMSESTPIYLLGQCILDEIQISPDLLKNALEVIVCSRDYSPRIRELPMQIYKGKYGGLLSEIVVLGLKKYDKNLHNFGGVLGEITLIDLGYEYPLSNVINADGLRDLILSANSMKRASGLFALMVIAFSSYRRENIEDDLQEYKEIVKLLSDSEFGVDFLSDFAACWAIAWLGNSKLFSNGDVAKLLPRLLELWQETDHIELQYVTAWAIGALPLLDRTEINILQKEGVNEEFSVGKLSVFLEAVLSTEKPIKHYTRTRKLAALTIAYYLGEPWGGDEIMMILMRDEYKGGGLNSKKLLDKLKENDEKKMKYANKNL